MEGPHTGGDGGLPDRGSTNDGHGIYGGSPRLQRGPQARDPDWGYPRLHGGLRPGVRWGVSPDQGS